METGNLGLVLCWGENENLSRALFQRERGMPVYCSVSSEKENASPIFYSGKKENLPHSLALSSLLLGLGERKNFSFLFCLGEKRTSVSVVLCSGDKDRFSLVFYLRKKESSV